MGAHDGQPRLWEHDQFQRAQTTTSRRTLGHVVDRTGQEETPRDQRRGQSPPNEVHYQGLQVEVGRRSSIEDRFATDGRLCAGCSDSPQAVLLARLKFPTSGINRDIPTLH